MNRLQVLRSATAGARPAGRLPGEIYTNWSDIQLGVVDAANQPVDLLAVRFFSALASYPIGSFVLQGTFLYRAIAAVTPAPFTPAQWEQVKMASDPPVGGPYLPLAGGTLTGPLVLAADAAAVLEAVPLQQLTAGLADYLPLAGGTMTGALNLAANAATALQAVPLQQLTAGLSDHLPLDGSDAMTGPLIGTIADFSEGVGAAGFFVKPTLVAPNRSVVSFVDASDVSLAAVFYDPAQNSMFVAHDGAGSSVHLDGGGNFVVSPGAAGNFLVGAAGSTARGFQAVAVNWSTFSDQRIKDVQGDYTLGLDEILQLRPVVYTLKGNDTLTDANTRGQAPYPASMHYSYAVEQKPCVGFVAQEVEQIFPDMVTEMDGFIDGQPVSDLRALNTSELIFALVNACKTLAARVEALETRAIFP